MTRNPAPVTAYIAFGSNLGDRLALVQQAAELLRRETGVRSLRLSTIRETEPQGTEDAPAPGGPYLNAVGELVTELEPIELLRRCQEIESRLGRVRAARNAPRTVDLDLLLYGDEVRSTPASAAGPALDLPHPRMLERRFVLEPLAELAPGAVHPVTRRTVAEHLRELRRP